MVAAVYAALRDGAMWPIPTGEPSIRLQPRLRYPIRKVLSPSLLSIIGSPAAAILVCLFSTGRVAHSIKFCWVVALRWLPFFAPALVPVVVIGATLMLLCVVIASSLLLTLLIFNIAASLLLLLLIYLLISYSLMVLVCYYPLVLLSFFSLAFLRVV